MHRAVDQMAATKMSSSDSVSMKPADFLRGKKEKTLHPRPAFQMCAVQQFQSKFGFVTDHSKKKNIIWGTSVYMDKNEEQRELSCLGLSCSVLCGSTTMPNGPIARWLSVMVIRLFATALRNLLLISRMICIKTIHLADAIPLLPVRLLSPDHLHFPLNSHTTGQHSLYRFFPTRLITGCQAYRWSAGDEGCQAWLPISTWRQKKSK